MIRVFTCFAGYGTDVFALKALGIEHEVVGFSEIDKYAIQCFQQNHCVEEEIVGDESVFHPMNYGDISKINWSEVPDFDLLTGGFPCTDVSNAGKQDLSKGRSILGFELTKALKEKQPKYFMFENVKGILANKFKPFLEELLIQWYNSGYFVGYKKLNTREHGIPQNRERVFFMGIRKDVVPDFQGFRFPKPTELKLKLKDLLEDEVDEKYFLKPEQVEKIMAKGSMRNRCMQNGEFSGTLLSRDYKDPKCVDVHNCLTEAIGRQGSSSEYISSVKKVNGALQELTKGVSDSQKIFNPNGVSCCLKALGGGQGAKTGLYVVGCAIRNKNRSKHQNKDDKNYGDFPKEYQLEKRKTEVSNAIKSASHECMVCFNEPTALDLYNKKERTDYSPCLSLPHHNSLRLGGGQGAKTGLYVVGCAVRSWPRTSSPSKDKELGRSQRLELNGGEFANSISNVQKDSMAFINNSRVRRLTPKECFRLQGFLEDEVNLEGLSDTQKYKLAGNGQSVNVVKLIFKELLECEKK
jgi:DNA (cytosine-5)-methyltransferase 1